MILTAAAALLLVETLAWLALVTSSRAFANYAPRPRLARVLGTAATIALCLWLACLLITAAETTALAVAGYVVAHILWIGERIWVQSTRRRPG